MLYVFRRGMEVCCHVCAKDERDMRRVNIRTRKSFPFGETNNKQNIIIVVVAFLFEEKTKRERERETPAKNDDQNASSLLLSERGMDVPCETLSKTTRSFVCKNSTSRGGGFFLCFIFRVSKKKRKKRRGEKGRGLCHSLRRACVRSLRSRLFPPKALTTIYHSLFCSKRRRRRRRMIPNALHKPFYTVRCSFVLSLCLSSTVAIFKSIQTAFVL